MEKHTTGHHSFANNKELLDAAGEYEKAEASFDSSRAEVNYLKAKAHAMAIVDFGYGGLVARGIDIGTAEIELHDGSSVPMVGELKELADLVSSTIDTAKLEDARLKVIKDDLWSRLKAVLNLSSDTDWTIDLKLSVAHPEEKSGGMDGFLAQMLGGGQ